MACPSTAVVTLLPVHPAMTINANIPKNNRPVTCVVIAAPLFISGGYQ
jgi:hypothetical protein